MIYKNVLLFFIEYFGIACGLTLESIQPKPKCEFHNANSYCLSTGFLKILIFK